MADPTITDMKGNVVKMEVDYSEKCDKEIPECEERAKVCFCMAFGWIFLFELVSELVI